MSLNIAISMIKAGDSGALDTFLRENPELTTQAKTKDHAYSTYSEIIQTKTSVCSSQIA